MISLLFLFLAILEKRISADAVLAAQRLHPVRPALQEPLMDAFNLYLCQISGLFQRQHLTVEAADTAVCGC